jgi:hypothetical protein
MAKPLDVRNPYESLRISRPVRQGFIKIGELPQNDFGPYFV